MGHERIAKHSSPRSGTQCSHFTSCWSAPVCAFNEDLLKLDSLELAIILILGRVVWNKGFLKFVGIRCIRHLRTFAPSKCISNGRTLCLHLDRPCSVEKYIYNWTRVPQLMGEKFWLFKKNFIAYKHIKMTLGGYICSWAQHDGHICYAGVVMLVLQGI